MNNNKPVGIYANNFSESEFRPSFSDLVRKTYLSASQGRTFYDSLNPDIWRNSMLQENPRVAKDLALLLENEYHNKTMPDVISEVIEYIKIDDYRSAAKLGLHSIYEALNEKNPVVAGYVASMIGIVEGSLNNIGETLDVASRIICELSPYALDKIMLSLVNIFYSSSRVARTTLSTPFDIADSVVGNVTEIIDESTKALSQDESIEDDTKRSKNKSWFGITERYD